MYVCNVSSLSPMCSFSHPPAVLVLEDNPAWDGLFEFCSISAGGSIGTVLPLLPSSPPNTSHLISSHLILTPLPSRRTTRRHRRL